MKRFLLLPLFLLLHLSAYAQTTFEPGYFINNEGRRTDCFIKQPDKSGSPNKIEYRLSEESESKLASIREVKEFEIINTSHKYQRHTVKVDKFSNSINDLTTEHNPNFAEEEIFLRVLVDGQASLYSFAGPKGVEVYFYSVNGSAIEQLVFRKYVTEEHLVNSNIQYKYQLLNSLKCDAITMDDFENLKYSLKSLSNLIVKYNECVQSTYLDYSVKRKQGTVYLAAKVGTIVSDMEVVQFISPGNVRYHHTFDQRLSPQFGLELAYTLPFNKNKWTIFLDPSMQLHRQQYDVERRHGSFFSSTYEPEGTLLLNMTRVTLPFGLKYSLHMGQDFSIFLSGAMVMNYVMGASFEFKNIDGAINKSPYHASQGLSVVPGAGLKYKRFSVEATYQVEKAKSTFETVFGYTEMGHSRRDHWFGNYSYPFTVAVGYRLYSKKM